MRLEEGYTVSEIAEAGNTTQESILALIRSGDLVAVNIGKGKERPRWRILESDWLRFLASRRNELPVRQKKKRSKPAGKDYFA